MRILFRAWASQGFLHTLRPVFVPIVALWILLLAPVAMAQLVAEDDFYVVDENSTLVEPAPGVLSNDTDALTAHLVGDVSNGSLTLNLDGSFTYTPDQDFTGSDSFTYRANDGSVDSNVATVTLTVNDVNEAPVAVNDAYDVDENDTLVVSAPGVLGNDTDADNDNLTAHLVGDVSNGSLTLNLDGSFTYTPDQDFTGSDSFTYRANDGSVDSNVATVTLTVNDVNEAPVAVNDAYDAREGVLLQVPAPGVLGNDDDPDDDALTAALVNDVSNGALQLRADGSFDYTADPGFSGTDTFTYRASDGDLESNVATVTITVEPNSPPAFTSVPPTAIRQGETYRYDAIATDDDGDDVVMTAPTLPGWLTLSDNGDGTASLTGTPGAGDVGLNQVVLEVSDGIADPVPQGFTIDVGPNDPPDFISVPVTEGRAGDPYNYAITVEDPDDDPIQIAAPTRPPWLDFVDNGDGTALLSVGPDIAVAGSHNVELHASDGIAPPAVQAFVIDIAPNERPDVVEGGIDAPNATETVPYQNVNAGEGFSFDDFFTDPDDTELFYDVTGLPDSLRVEPLGCLPQQPERRWMICGVPDEDDVGQHVVDVVVRDREDPMNPFVQSEHVTFQLRVLALDEIDISIALAATPDPAPVNEDVQWQLTVSNDSQLAANQVEVTANFAGTPFTLNDTGGCVQSGQTLTCTIAAVPPQGSAAATITGRSLQAGEVLLEATAKLPDVLGGAIDPDEDDNFAVAVLNIGQSFSAGPAAQLQGPNASRGLAAGDFNGNGYIDLVLASTSGGRVFLSEPRFAEPESEDFRVLSESPVIIVDAGTARDVVLVDLDDDGRLDLVFANGGSNSNAQQHNPVFLNQENNGAIELLLFATLGNASSYAVAAADLTGNGLPDLVFANDGPNDIFLNQGNAGFAAGGTLGEGETRDVLTVDFDGDGLRDVLFVNQDGPSLLYRNRGSVGGTLEFDDPITVADAPMVSAQAVDVNGDGFPDLVLGRLEAAVPELPANPVALNTSVPGTISFVPATVTLGGSPTLKVRVADINQDGVGDVAVLNATGTHQVFRGAGNSSFTLQPEQFSSLVPAGAVFGDFNNDGRPDLAISRSGGIDVFLNDGFGNLGPGDVTPPVIQRLGEASVEVLVGATYSDAGATATDDADGPLTDRIEVDNPVDTAVIGTYTVTYRVRDRSGNAAVPVTRTVRVGTQQDTRGGGGGALGWLFVVLLFMLSVARRAPSYVTQRASLLSLPHIPGEQALSHYRPVPRRRA